jgi:hypothetical protein
MKTLVLTFAVLLSVMTVSLAQSLTNFGPNAPWYGDSYGKLVSGTYPPLQKRGYGAYAYRPYFESPSSILPALSTLVVTGFCNKMSALPTADHSNDRAPQT